MNIARIISTKRIISPWTFKLCTTTGIAFKMVRKCWFLYFSEFFSQQNTSKEDNTTTWKDTDSIPVFLFGDSAHPLLPFIMKEFSGGGSIQNKSSSQLRIHLVHLKPVLDTYNVLWILIQARVLYSCLALHNNFEI